MIWPEVVGEPQGHNSQILLRKMIDYVKSNAPASAYFARVLRAAPADPRDRISAVVQWRQAFEARRDAALVFKAAREGRPLELAKRLRLGRLAGALETKEAVVVTSGNSALLTPLEAAKLGGHSDCVATLESLAI